MPDLTHYNYKRSRGKQFDYGAIPVGYYDEVFHRNKGVQSKWHQLKFSVLRSRLKGYEHHLDIGCGPGTFIGTLGEEHLSVGVDISASQIDFAHNKYGTSRKRFELIDEDLSLFENDVFDVVTIVELLEHLLPKQSNRLLREAMRVLRPGGLLVVSTPNYDGLWYFVESLVNRLSPISYSDQHITRFTHATLHDLLKRCGLESLSVITYMFAAPFMANLAWRFADLVNRLEPVMITSRWGLLLLGMGTKSL